MLQVTFCTWCRDNKRLFHKNFTFSPSSIKRCVFLSSFSSLSLYPCTLKDCCQISQASPTAIGMTAGKVGDVTSGCFSTRYSCCHILLSHSCATTCICSVYADSCHIFGDTFISNKKVFCVVLLGFFNLENFSCFPFFSCWQLLQYRTMHTKKR